MLLILMGFDGFPCAHLFIEMIYYLYCFHGTFISVFHFVLEEPPCILTILCGVYMNFRKVDPYK